MCIRFLLIGLIACVIAACGDGEGNDATSDGGTDTDTDGDADECLESGWQRIDTGDWAHLKGISTISPDDVYFAAHAYAGSNAVAHFDGESLVPIDSPIKPDVVWSTGADGVLVADSTTGDVARYDGAAWELLRSRPAYMTGLWVRAADDAIATALSSFGPSWDPILHYDGDAWSSMDVGIVPLSLTALWGRSDGAAFAVGDRVMAYDGASWSEMDMGGITLESGLRAVTGTDAGELWVAGEIPDFYHYDGTVWEVMDLSALGWDTIYINQLWASGADDVYARGEAYMDDWESSAYFFGHFDGTAWTEVWTDEDPCHGPYDLDGDGPSDVVAVGGNGDGACVMRFDGTSWSSLGDSGIFGADFLAKRVFVGGVDDVVVGGWRNAEDEGWAAAWVAWAYDGASWTKIVDQPLPWEPGWGVSAIDYREGTFWFAGEQGEVWRYDGAAWVETNRNPCPGVNALWGAGATDAFAACNAGGMLRWDGEAWTEMETGIDLALVDLWGSGPDDVYAVGFNESADYTWASALLHWDGAAWAEVDLGFEVTVTRVFGLGAEEVFVAGFDGEPYELVMLGYDGAAWSVAPIPDETCWGWGLEAPFIGDLWGFDNGGTAELFAVTAPCMEPVNNGTYLRYDGAAWERVAATDDTDATFLAVGGTGPEDIWLAGEDGLLLHYPCE